MAESVPATVDEYIALFPKNIQERLCLIRSAIREAAPEAAEKISYQMPTYHQNGNVVHFAAFRDHISLFPAPSGVEAFADRLTAYKTSKGTIQFPHAQPLPLELIGEITRWRADENTRIAEARQRRNRK